MAVVVATDLTKHSEAALRTGWRWAASRDEDLVVVYCVEAGFQQWLWGQLVDGSEAMEARLRTEANERLHRQIDGLEEAESSEEVTVETVVMLDDPMHGVQTAVEEHPTSLLVVGTRSKGSDHLGSTAEQLVRSSAAPVLVVPSHISDPTIERILAPVDLTECSRQSLFEAIEIARLWQAELLIHHAFVMPSSTGLTGDSSPTGDLADDPNEADQWERFHEFLEDYDLSGIEHRNILRLEKAAPSILESASKQQVDLIVMGTHSGTGIMRFVFGSHAIKVLRDTPCPVLVVRENG
jgi:nucleotide-binding universal stress UspA family protein